MVLYETEHCKFIYDKEKELLYQHWFGFTSPKVFENAINKFMELARSYKIVYVLSDTTESAILKQESRDYAASLMPELVGLGLKKMAFILPEKIFVEVGVKDFSNRSQRATSDADIVRQFSQLEKAKEWLFNSE